MIGGEFDLSSGVMIGSSGLFAGLLITEYNIGVWPSIFLTFLFAAAIGFTNGWLVVTTGLPLLHRDAGHVLPLRESTSA